MHRTLLSTRRANLAVRAIAQVLRDVIEPTVPDLVNLANGPLILTFEAFTFRAMGHVLVRTCGFS